MSFKNRVKNRKINKFVTTFLKIFKFRWLNLPISWKTILFWIIVNIISLFLPWVYSSDGKWLENSFSKLSGWIGRVILIILLFLLFNLFSINNKEKIKLHFWVHFRDYPVSIILWIFTIILWIVSINFINSHELFYNNIENWLWVILSISSSIVILIWWIIQKIEFGKFSKTSKFYDYEWLETNMQSNHSKENNMKLPF